nr:B236 [uncultured bacterium]
MENWRALDAPCSCSLWPRRLIRDAPGAASQGKAATQGM